MLLVSIRRHLISLLRHKYLILAPIIRTLYLCEQGSEEPWLFFKAKRSPRVEKSGKNWYRSSNFINSVQRSYNQSVRDLVLVLVQEFPNICLLWPFSPDICSFYTVLPFGYFFFSFFWKCYTKQIWRISSCCHSVNASPNTGRLPNFPRTVSDCLSPLPPVAACLLSPWQSWPVSSGNIFCLLNQQRFFTTVGVPRCPWAQKINCFCTLSCSSLTWFENTPC